MKINKYNYSCKECGKVYSEQRREDEPNYISLCFVCGKDFIEQNVIFVENYVEPEIVEIVVDETLAE